MSSNPPNLASLALLQQRHSVPSRQLGAPAPDETTLHALLEAAIRVPDHGKLVPFRLIRLEGEAKLEFGDRVAAISQQNNAGLSDAKLEKDRLRYTFAPLVIAVIVRLDSTSKVPEIEQKLCAGNVAHNILLGAHALGYGAQWLTGWAAYDRDVAKLLGLSADEHVIGFMHLGTPQIEVPDRDRPALADLLSTWAP
ncbi:nitroreductase [Rhodanobacter sp. AS-Z3]|uniref:nitroreductase family protein n=1 Tax=Rhodanobacter sp. AS-Z3 TaxID=3031330 RepID=UPI002478D9E8|nr:nitroreductase [Rhodanobacter sp. AS-Z3]WEN16351.1 nitroreductase [Rhodanobacter sp. AS-Z3]